MIPIKQSSKFDEYLEDYKERINDLFGDVKPNEINENFKKDFSEVDGINNFDFIEITTAPFSVIKEWYDKIEPFSNNFKQIDKAADGKPKLKNIYKDIVEKYDRLIKKSENKIKTNVLIFKMFNIQVCPYCNANYVNNRGGYNSGGELDHFYDKSTFPIFSMSLYNFVPSCSSCNRSKSTNKISVSPHDCNFDINNSLKFSYVPKSLNFLSNDEQLDIDMRIMEKNGVSLEENIRQLKIYEAYEIHKSYIREVITKALIYNESQIEEYLESYPELFKEKKDVLRVIFGNYTSEEDYGKRPLSKLTKDILSEFGVEL